MVGQRLDFAPFRGRLRRLVDQLCHLLLVRGELSQGGLCREESGQDLAHPVTLHLKLVNVGRLLHYLSLELLDFLLFRLHFRLALGTSYGLLLPPDDLVHHLRSLLQERDVLAFLGRRRRGGRVCICEVGDGGVGGVMRG